VLERRSNGGGGDLTRRLAEVDLQCLDDGSLDIVSLLPLIPCILVLYFLYWKVLVEQPATNPRISYIRKKVPQ
jgi:hypothetical protein